MELLYEDAALVCAVKPVGIPSQGDAPDAMPARLAAQLGLPAVYPVHRLDQAVGGAILFARTPEAAARLSAALQDGSVRKEYLAVLAGVPESPEGTLTDLLFHDKVHNKSYVVRRRRTGVREASLSYRVLAARDGLALVRVLLHTGRTHQIRVQFSSRGLPLLGDGKYGSRDNRCGPALWSYRMELAEPRRVFLARPPEEFPWNLFDRGLYDG
jgi:23S rRNA pseudouridine1911/1915/1917 synthase